MAGLAAGTVAETGTSTASTVEPTPHTAGPDIQLSQYTPYRKYCTFSTNLMLIQLYPSLPVLPTVILYSTYTPLSL